MARLRRAPVTVTIVALNLAAFGWVALHGSTTDAEVLFRFGALERNSVWMGEWWRLLTAAFLHIGPIHLAANLVFGTPWCLLVEEALGAGRFAALYLAAAVGGSAVSLLAMRLSGIPLSAGASGALFGAIGATLAMHRRGLGSWQAFFASRATRSTLVNLAVFALVTIWLPVDHGAHAGGFAAGAAFAWAVTEPRGRRLRAAGLVAAALVGVSAAALRPTAGFREARALAEIHAALQAEEPARASALLEAARADGVSSPWLHYYEALLDHRRGHVDRARETFRRLADGPPGEPRDAARRSLRALCDLGDAASCPPG